MSTLRTEIAARNAATRARSAILRAKITATGRSVRVPGGSYGISYNGKGEAVLCFIPD